MKQKVTPSLWFDQECEEAINFYVETFNKNPASVVSSNIVSIYRYPEGQPIGPMKNMEGKVLTAIFELKVNDLWHSTEVRCSNSTSLYHSMLSAKHKQRLTIFGIYFQQFRNRKMRLAERQFGVSWQIIPRQMGEFLSDPDMEKAGRVMQAMLQMKKIEIAELKKAYDQT